MKKLILATLLVAVGVVACGKKDSPTSDVVTPEQAPSSNTNSSDFKDKESNNSLSPNDTKEGSPEVIPSETKNEESDKNETSEQESSKTQPKSNNSEIKTDEIVEIKIDKDKDKED